MTNQKEQQEKRNIQEMSIVELKAVLFDIQQQLNQKQQEYQIVMHILEEKIKGSE